MGRACIKHCLLIFIAFSLKSPGQSFFQPNLCKPDVIRFSNHFYCVGYTEDNKGLSLDVLSLNIGTDKMDSTHIRLGKQTCEKLYTPQLDTTHGYLNIIIQEVNNDKTCQIIRLNKNLNLVANIANAEVSRVNSFTAQEKEILFDNNNLYVVRPFAKDSTNQFVLQKYCLKDSTTLFEYNTLWQIPFAKQKYHRCHIVAANDHFVYLFVNVLEGTKHGQWMLFIDPEKGEILHSERLNDDNEGFVYLYGSHYYNHQTKEMSICGYRLPEKLVKPDYTGVDFSLPKTKTAPVFLCTYDSAGHATEWFHDFVSLPAELATEKEFKHFIFKINKFLYYNNQYTFLYELIAGNPGANSFKTYGLEYTVVDHNEEKSLQAKTNVFLATYRDKNNKNAQNIFSLYNMDLKHNADEILYKPAVSGCFKEFNWKIQFGNERLTGYSVYNNKKDNLFYTYILTENKWQIKELSKVPSAAFFKTYLHQLDKIHVFKNTSYEPEEKISRGLEGSIIKLE